MFGSGNRWHSWPTALFPSSSLTTHGLAHYYHFILLISLLCMVSFGLANHINNKTEVRVLWTYPTPISDFGFTFALEEARMLMEDKLSQHDVFLHSHYVHNFSIPDCLQIATQLLSDGLDGQPYDLWVAGGSQFQACVLAIDLDPRFAALKILNIAGGGQVTDRISTATGSTQDGRYLHGVLCAQASKSRVLGYVSSIPRTSASVARGLAAFALGAWSVDPTLRIVTGISGDFLHVVAETKATEILISEANADCIASNQNDLTVHEVANAHGAFSVGFASDARYFMGELVLNSILFDWVPVLNEFFDMILNDSWIPRVAYDWSLREGGTKLSGYSTLVDPEWRPKIDETEARILNGTLYPFCTPHLRDPAWLDPNITFELSPGVNCVKPENYNSLLGVITGVEVLVEYNTTHTPYEHLRVRWRSPAGAFLAIISGLLMISALVSSVVLVVYRHTPVYRASSPLFLHIILIGVFIGTISPFMWIGKRTVYSCMLTWWTIGIGYGIIYACLLAKNWRIWRIFASGRLKRVVILNAELMGKFVGVIVSLEILLLVLWQVFDPYVPKIYHSPSFAIDQLQIICEPRSGKVYAMGASLVYNAFVLLPIIFVSYWTRHAKEEYRESRPMALVVYANLVVFCVVTGVITAIPHNYLLNFYMVGYGTWILMFTVYAALFIPKHWRTHFAAAKPTTTEVGLSTLQSEHGFESVMYTAQDSRVPANSVTQQHVDNPSLESEEA